MAAGAQLWVSLDSQGVLGLRLAGRGGRVRVAACARAPLPPGALQPSLTGGVLADRQAVSSAVAGVLRQLDAVAHAPTGVLLPDGLARLALLQVPAGVAPTDFARFRLAASLPLAASEVVVGTLALRRGAVVAAALARSSADALEEAVVSAGARPVSVGLSSLAALRAAAGRNGKGEGVLLLLGDTTVTYAALRGGTLLGLRQRLLDGNGAARSADDAARTALAAGLSGGPTLLIAGRGAQHLQAELAAEGHAARSLDLALPGAPPDVAELAWPAGVLE